MMLCRAWIMVFWSQVLFKKNPALLQNLIIFVMWLCCCSSNQSVDSRKKKEWKQGKKGGPAKAAAPTCGSDGGPPDMGALCIWSWSEGIIPAYWDALRFSICCEFDGYGAWFFFLFQQKIISACSKREELMAAQVSTKSSNMVCSLFCVFAN